MKLILTAIVLGTLAGCAAITEQTGATEAQQLCVALSIAEKARDVEAERNILADLAEIRFRCFVAKPAEGGAAVLLAVPG